MYKTSMSLIDVLEPPMNLWLRKLGRRSAELPTGVRIVRFSEADDELTGEIDEPPRPQRAAKTCVAA